MKRGDFVRLTVYQAPSELRAPNLSVLVLISEKVSVMEGWLSGHIQVGSEIRLVARVKDQKPVSGCYTSAPILEVKNQYAQGGRLVYEITNISPPTPEETFADFA